MLKHLKAPLLLVEDDPHLAKALEKTLRYQKADVVVCQRLEQVHQALEQHTDFSFVLCDMQLSKTSTGFDVLELIQKKNLQCPFLMMTAYGSIAQAVQAMQQGAIDYILKPFDPDQLLQKMADYAGTEPTVEAQPKQSTPHPLHLPSPAMQRLQAMVKKIALKDVSVMIHGPSGVGKEVIARALHQASQRRKQPFVAINCAAIPEHMLEAMLFGYEKGAFTGAVQSHAGKFEQAQKGTLLLDEITEMAMPLQAKLLRVLQEKELERLGSAKTLNLDVRVIATSNRDLKEAIRQGRFREDLYYRLAVFSLDVPALVDRPEDILPLAQRLMEKHQLQATLSEQAQEALCAYPWPGNVRELENVIQRAAVMDEDGILQVDDILLDERASAVLKDSASAENPSFEAILSALRSHAGQRKRCAEALGISPRTLRHRLTKMRSLGYDLSFLENPLLEEIHEN